MERNEGGELSLWDPGKLSRRQCVLRQEGAVLKNTQRFRRRLASMKAVCGGLISANCDVPSTPQILLQKCIFIRLFWRGIVCLLGCVCRGQRTNCDTRVSPSTMWILVIQLKFQGSAARAFPTSAILPGLSVLTNRIQSSGVGIKQNHPEGLRRNHQNQRRTTGIK